MQQRALGQQQKKAAQAGRGESGCPAKDTRRSGSELTRIDRETVGRDEQPVVARSRGSWQAPEPIIQKLDEKNDMENVLNPFERIARQ